MSSHERTVPAMVLTRLRRRLCDSEPAGRIPVTEAELFDILADNRRKGTIDRLAEAPDEPVPRRELAADLAVEELHMPLEHVPQTRIDEIDAELERTHLPKLADADIVRWDVDGDEVTPGHSLAPVAEWLEALERLVEPVPDRQRNHRDAFATPWVPTDEA